MLDEKLDGVEVDVVREIRHGAEELDRLSRGLGRLVRAEEDRAAHDDVLGHERRLADAG